MQFILFHMHAINNEHTMRRIIMSSVFSMLSTCNVTVKAILNYPTTIAHHQAHINSTVNYALIGLWGIGICLLI